MKYEEVINEVVSILQGHNGKFVTAYQICQQIEQSYQDLWARLTAEYPSIDPDVTMGEGTGSNYSPASFVANALKHHSTQNSQISQEWLSCEGVTFNGVAPGFTGNFVGIWAFRA